MTMIEMIPTIVTIVEVVKRFIPDKYRAWANPAISLVLGLGLAYTQGGAAALLDGVGAAAGAVATYKVPKVVGGMVVKDEKE